MTYELGFVGAGNMAEAIARGVLKAGMVGPSAVIAADPSEARRNVFDDELGTAVTADSGEVVRSSKTVILAVKPQVMDDVLGGIADAFGADTLVVSIIAGKTAEAITAATGGRARRIVRVMPNTPMLVGAGMSAVAGTGDASADDVALVQRIFDAGGKTVIVEESQIDAVIAVSGSGPAYFFYFVEALIQAGVREGLAEADADMLARQTILGAGRLLAESSDSPAELRRKVTSPGGTTEAAIKSLNASHVDEAIIAAAVAAKSRSVELSGQ